MPNAHRAYVGAANKTDYLAKLTLSDEELKPLRAAREEIRNTLRKAVPAWKERVNEQALFDSASGGDERTVRTPKFRLQGSLAYHTLNAPAHLPPQEIDSDDGMFLPVSYLSQNGATRPAVVSAALFHLVETALRPLCEERRWSLEEKDTCVRVRISKKEHLDLAMYAIPDSDFALLVEANVALNRRAIFDSAAELEEPDYVRIPTDKIMLAHRKKHWTPSDPRKLENWFNKAIEKHGYQLRRVCRYLKGWRDHTWQKKGPSSIALMQCAVTIFGDIAKELDESRDDLAMVKIAERLPALLAQRIENPVVPGQYLDEGWSAEERQEYVQKARDFSRSVAMSMQQGKNAAGVLAYLKTAFGGRIPDDPSLVIVEEDDPKSSSTASSTLISAGKSPEPQSAVIKSGGGRYA